MIGILVDGDNHFIVAGSEPDAETARALAAHWSIIRIGGETPVELRHWTIRNKAFREDLQWAVVLHTPLNPAVVTLLEEIRSRGVSVRYLDID